MNPTKYVTGSYRFCSTPAFWSYLSHRTGMTCTSQDAAAIQLRQLLGIQSRKELASNEPARAAWREIVDDYNGWRRRTMAGQAVR
jgi:hypothetical protein